MPWRKTPSHNVLVLSTRQQPYPARSSQSRLISLASPPHLLPVCLNPYHPLFHSLCDTKKMSMSSSDEKRGIAPPPHPTQPDVSTSASAWRTIRAARVRFLVFAVAIVVLLVNYGHRVVLTVTINTSASTAECDAVEALEATEWTTEDWDKVCHSLDESMPE